VLYISIHRYEDGTFYPCGELGGPKSCGKGAGLGLYVSELPEKMWLTHFSSVNVPWSGPGMGDADYLYVFHHIVMPIAMEFSPELVFGDYFLSMAHAPSDTPQYLQVSTLQMVMTLENVM
jgi:histone deacetylase 6